MQATTANEDLWRTQENSGKLGIWLFVLSEVMLFGGFIAGYVMIRWGSADCALGTPAWPKPGYSVGLTLATVNTLLLITSSWTMVRAGVFSREGDRAAFTRNLTTTLLLGLGFL